HTEIRVSGASAQASPTQRFQSETFNTTQNDDRAPKRPPTSRQTTFSTASVKGCPCDYVGSTSGVPHCLKETHGYDTTWFLSIHSRRHRCSRDACGTCGRRRTRSASVAVGPGVAGQIT